MTDMMIARKVYTDARNLIGRMQVRFELKKVVQDYHVYQAIRQLFVANILSQQAVFVILTDLNDEWIFYWLEIHENKNEGYGV